MSERSFVEQPNNRARGRVGEDDAVAWLMTQGYRILERNVVNEAGEIDAVAEDGETLCFLEIKARVSQRYGLAIAAVSPAKQRRISRAAALYLARRKSFDVACRFDVLGLDRGVGCWRFTLIRDAFSYCP